MSCSLVLVINGELPLVIGMELPLVIGMEGPVAGRSDGERSDGVSFLSPVVGMEPLIPTTGDRNEWFVSGKVYRLD